MKLSAKKKIRIATGVSAVALACLVSTGYIILIQPEVSGIALHNFKPGVQLTYEAEKQNGLILTGKVITDDAGYAELPFPKKISEKNGSDVEYKLKVEDPNRADVKALELLMKLDKDQKNVLFSGAGLDNSADVMIKNAQDEFSVKSDWSGMFSQDIPVSGDVFEMAFRSQNMANDALMGDNAKIEVLSIFGENSRDDTTGTVRARYGRTLRVIGTKLSGMMVKQTEMIGAFFDAKIQLDTQRKFQELKARAHKEYHPSEQMCRFGTFIKSIAAAESKADADKKYLNKVLMSTYLGLPGSSAEDAEGTAAKARIELFIKNYCDPQDHNGGLDVMCPNVNKTTMTPAARDRLNKDVDYTKTIDTKLTLDIDYADYTAPTMAPVLTDEETDVIAMAKNLYMPQVFANPDKGSVNRDPRWHFASRSFAAKMNVAHTSFLNLIGMKAAAPEGRPTTAIASLPNLPTNMQVNTATPNVRTGMIATKGLVLTEDAGWSYMKALLREFNLSDDNANGTRDDEIENMLGVRPSYYAQMEVLTKKIYQSPNFYTNLYDKPANVKRMGVAMDAIALMHLRDRYDSQLRQELLAAMLVETALGPVAEKVSSEIYSGMKEQQGKR